ncbi:MAG TPA: zinc-binding dehydrogenase, partial [Longimicrobiales bacterium]|nr:zinc-binding dehydrogenase [Longimicrobiales bacterium]
SASKGPDAKRLGADQYVVTSEQGALDRYQGHFDFILNTVSAPHDLMGPLGTLRRDGTMIVVGASPDPLPLPTFPLLFGRRTVLGSLIGGIPETQEMLDFCGKHGIVSEIEKIDPPRINEAYRRTLASDVKYRFVIDCTMM